MKRMRAAKAISILTVAPMVALLVSTCLFVYDARFFGGWAWYLISLLFLTLVPLSAYALKRVLPGYKDKGRDGERKLAFIMAIAGYTVGTICALVFRAPQGALLILLTYFFTGFSLTLFNLFHIKASGHACGFVGPVVVLMYWSKFYFWYLLLLLPFVYWARLKMKRHTVRELVVGTLVGIIVPLVSVGLVSILIT